jgi:hypothetical protein
MYPTPVRKPIVRGASAPIAPPDTVLLIPSIVPALVSSNSGETDVFGQQNMVTLDCLKDIFHFWCLIRMPRCCIP